MVVVADDVVDTVLADQRLEIVRAKGEGSLLDDADADAEVDDMWVDSMVGREMNNRYGFD